MANKIINTAPPYTHVWYIKILKIEKHTSIIDIGICIEEIVIRNKFQFGSWTELGHGNFTISSEGRSYSSIDNTLHKLTHKLTFVANDIIKVEYNIVDNTLTFTKRSPESSVEKSTHIKIPKIPTDQNIRPCVYFIGEDSSVALVDENW